VKEYKNAQGLALSACLISEVAITKVMDKLELNNFSVPALRDVFQAICSLFIKNTKIDVVTLATEMKQLGLQFDKLWLYDEFDGAVGFDSNIDDHIKIILNHTLTINAKKITAKINNKIIENEPINETIDFALEEFMNINKEDAINVFNSQEAVLDTVKKTQKINSSKVQIGLQTDIYDLNKIVIFKKQNVIILAAKKSVGKSALMSQIVFFNARKGMCGGMILLEGTINDLTNREIARIGSIDYGDITRGKMDSEQFTRYQKASEEFAKYPILYSLKRGLTFPQIKSKLIMMKNKLGRLDFIVIDYVQKIRTPKGHSRQRELADVSEELGVLAQEFDCPLFALSQVNDGGRTREAEDLENDADIVLKLRREVFEYRSLFIKTDKFPKLNGENMPEDYATLQITKNKNGRTGGVELRSKLEYQRFEDWDKVY